jgi:ATP-dependent Clp protease ATP-binding subunit ClpA
MKRSKASAPITEAQLNQLPDVLHQRIRGQKEVIQRAVDVVQRRETEVVPQRGARGTMILAGPTGVGKTLLALTLAQGLFGPDRLVRIDCSEFKTLNSYEGLFGNRTGDEGRFGQAYAKVPEGIWLFDEIEKAHPDFVHLFLQGADAARLTLANGKMLSLERIYLLLTTNVGSSGMVGREHLPFASLENHVSRTIENWLRPELLGRFGRPFVFRPLDREAQQQITQDRVAEIVQWNRVRGREITVHPNVIPFLACRGFSRRLGARPLQQTIEELVGNAIKSALLRGETGSGTLILSGDQLLLVP